MAYPSLPYAVSIPYEDHPLCQRAMDVMLVSCDRGEVDELLAGIVRRIAKGMTTDLDAVIVGGLLTAQASDVGARGVCDAVNRAVVKVVQGHLN